jgi:hypothetical protein
VRRSWFTWLALTAALLASPAGAQPNAVARTVDGRVLVQREKGPDPVVGEWVTLHRVAGDSAGPLDSTRTDATGAYTFRYRAFGSDDAIYFVSARYGGVAYFTNPLRGPHVRGEGAELDVFDTTSAHVPTTVRGRHLIVSAGDARGMREIIEVYEISNDTSVTKLDDARGTWSVPVPAKGRDFRVREGEVPADAMSFTGGRAALHMPFAPGLKQIAFSYALPIDEFPLDLVPDRNTSVFEVLVEDPRATVSGPKIAPVDPVVVEGRSFRRFLAQDVPAGSRLTIDAPPPPPSWTRWIVPGLLGVLGLGMVSALAFPRRRRARPTPAAAPIPVLAAAPLDADAADLAQRIAALDDAFDREDAPSEAMRESYQRERAELKSELAAALARTGVAH